MLFLLLWNFMNFHLLPTSQVKSVPAKKKIIPSHQDVRRCRVLRGEKVRQKENYVAVIRFAARHFEIVEQFPFLGMPGRDNCMILNVVVFQVVKPVFMWGPQHVVKYEVTEKRNKLKSSKQELDDVFFFAVSPEKCWKARSLFAPLPEHGITNHFWTLPQVEKSFKYFVQSFNVEGKSSPFVLWCRQMCQSGWWC